MGLRGNGRQFRDVALVKDLTVRWDLGFNRGLWLLH